MELNADIVRQLYGKIPSAIKTSGNSHRRHIRYSSSARLPCLKAFYCFFTEVEKALPNYKLLLNNIVVSGNKVLTRYTISGTPEGKFRGLPPTGAQMTIKGIDIFRLDGGRIAEYWDSAHQIAFSSSIPHNPTAELRLERPGITFQKKQPSLGA